MGYYKQKLVEQQASEEYDEFVALFLKRQPKAVDLWNATLDVFDVEEQQLDSGRSPRHVEARHVFWNALYLLGWSCTEIAEFTNHNRTSIYPALGKEETKAKAKALIVLVEREKSLSNVRATPKVTKVGG